MDLNICELLKFPTIYSERAWSIRRIKYAVVMPMSGKSKVNL